MRLLLLIFLGVSIAASGCASANKEITVNAYACKTPFNASGDNVQEIAQDQYSVLVLIQNDSCSDLVYDKAIAVFLTEQNTFNLWTNQEIERIQKGEVHAFLWTSQKHTASIIDETGSIPLVFGMKLHYGDKDACPTLCYMLPQINRLPLIKNPKDIPHQGNRLALLPSP